MPLLCLLALLQPAISIESAELEFQLDPSDGHYSVLDKKTGWHLAGDMGGPVAATGGGRGKDRLGAFQSVSFSWTDPVPVRATVRLYANRPVAFFTLEYLAPVKGNGIVFPDFHRLPTNLKVFSYRDSTFAPPVFRASDTCTPWLFFDSHAGAMILSPARNFMVSDMVGDGEQEAGCGLNKQLKQVPKGFEQDAILAVGQGIGRTWDVWGAALRARYVRQTPSNDSGSILRDFGYWTDNGADYYYNYEPRLGYAGTLLAVRDQYRREGIPLGYMQLDSWWYDKSIDDPSGKPGGLIKNPNLPAGAWNRYGGLMEYRADSDLFPDGLSSFQQRLGLPLVVHNRWIDRRSPYHRDYRISGVASVDPKWWNDVASYLITSGVVCYEQDWLDRIYQNSPEMASISGVGDEFTSVMDYACASHGLDIQYCMPSPRFIMQGLECPDLTTIRASDDRFEPSRWNHFLFVSQFAQEMGIWPWSDVFKSGETGNMILSVLSAGPVGTGDRLGMEDKQNILMAALPDGVIVKPDRSIVPCDQSYLDPSAPLLASTSTTHGQLETLYLFAFPRRFSDRTVIFTLNSIAANGSDRWYLYDFQTGEGNEVRGDQPISETIGASGYGYWIAAPVTRSGIALIGDLGKFVSTGKQRLASIQDSDSALRVQLRLARGERVVTIQGFSSAAPKVTARVGGAKLTGYDRVTGRFEVSVSPPSGRKGAEFVVSRS